MRDAEGTEREGSLQVDGEGGSQDMVQGWAQRLHRSPVRTGEEEGARVQHTQCWGDY